MAAVSSVEHLTTSFKGSIFWNKIFDSSLVYADGKRMSSQSGLRVNKLHLNGVEEAEPDGIHIVSRDADPLDTPVRIKIRLIVLSVQQYTSYFHRECFTSSLYSIPSAETWHFYLDEPLPIMELDEKVGSAKLTSIGQDIIEKQLLQYTTPPNATEYEITIHDVSNIELLDSGVENFADKDSPNNAPVKECGCSSNARFGFWAKTLPVIVDDMGNLTFDTIMKQNENSRKIVYSQHRVIIQKVLKDDEKEHDQEDDDNQKDIEETTEQTKTTLYKIVNVRLSAAQPKND
ncbi:hypothetical protein CTI12_AA412710 [Artemisia annua]|uniref:Uncharacterized protein n=1 Tax=Artemisia annua TaxID=35608 RepID=A0A2U1M7G5_ARTAN|nr:hypothetical protein CTI12_AA412710 [Artemisia annua]